MIVTVYGLGGFDPNASDKNIVEEYEVPDGPLPAPTIDDRIVELEAQAAQQEAVVAKLLEKGVLTVDDVPVKLEGL